MSNEIEIKAREELINVLGNKIPESSIDVHKNMMTYGLTSLKKVLFITSLCKICEVDLGQLTEEHLAKMSSLNHVVEILNHLKTPPETVA